MHTSAATVHTPMAAMATPTPGRSLWVEPTYGVRSSAECLVVVRVKGCPVIPSGLPAPDAATSRVVGIDHVPPRCLNGVRCPHPCPQGSGGAARRSTGDDGTALRRLALAHCPGVQRLPIGCVAHHDPPVEQFLGSSKSLTAELRLARFSAVINFRCGRGGVVFLAVAAGSSAQASDETALDAFATGVGIGDGVVVGVGVAVPRVAPKGRVRRWVMLWPSVEMASWPVPWWSVTVRVMLPSSCWTAYLRRRTKLYTTTPPSSPQQAVAPTTRRARMTDRRSVPALRSLQRGRGSDQ